MGFTGEQRKQDRTGGLRKNRHVDYTGKLLAISD
jgi:hypothetical protein